MRACRIIYTRTRSGSWLSTSKGRPSTPRYKEEAAQQQQSEEPSIACLDGLGERFRDQLDFAVADTEGGLFVNLLGALIEVVVTAVLAGDGEDEAGEREVCRFLSQSGRAMAHQPNCIMSGSRYCLALCANLVS